MQQSSPSSAIGGEKGGGGSSGRKEERRLENKPDSGPEKGRNNPRLVGARTERGGMLTMETINGDVRWELTRQIT